ncbi:MAG: hypothetical protein LBC68_08935, partial [Prevotellaceae bacterium]|nr:hypothetical protein [Prevotellaceae bacterium]
GTYPENFGTYPENFGIYPENFGIYPEDFGIYPEDFGTYPENFGTYPENFGICSEDSVIYSENSVTCSELYMQHPSASAAPQAEHILSENCEFALFVNLNFSHRSAFIILFFTFANSFLQNTSQYYEFDKQ